MSDNSLQNIGSNLPSVIEIDPNKEYILCGDISGSMSTPDHNCGGQRRFDYMLEKFQLFVKTAEDFDAHGAPTVLLFGEKVHVYKDTKAETIEKILPKIDFEGFTYIHLCLEKAYELHLDEKREAAKQKKFHPGTVVFIFTDGAPSNRPAVERTLVDIANRIEREDEFQISFLTVGTINADLASYLKNLHDGLEDKIKTGYDIIHIDRLENVTFMGAVKGKNHN